MIELFPLSVVNLLPRLYTPTSGNYLPEVIQGKYGLTGAERHLATTLRDNFEKDHLVSQADTLTKNFP